MINASTGYDGWKYRRNPESCLRHRWLRHTRFIAPTVTVRLKAGHYANVRLKPDTTTYSIDLTMSSTTFFASPNTIIVLSM